MDDVDERVSEAEALFKRGLVTRRQFAAALLALGIGASYLDGLVGSEAWARQEELEVPHSDRRLVLIVIDGFRADYMSLAPMHHLRALMARGTAYDTAWVGHLESETPSGHATLATGVYPRTHSVIGFGWRDVASGTFGWPATNLGVIRTGHLAATIRGGGARSIADLIHSRRDADRVVSVSGEKFYAAAALGVGADHIVYGENDSKGVFRPVSIGPSPPPPSADIGAVRGESDFESQDLFAAEVAVRLARAVRPRALLVNLPDTDLAGHYYGGIAARAQMTRVVRVADRAIGRIVDEYRRLGLLHSTVFVVTSDHGMVANRHIVPIHPMYRTVSHAGSVVLDQELRISMGSVWLGHIEEDRQVAAALSTRRFGHVDGALYKVPSGSGWAFVPDPATAGRLPVEVLEAYLHLAQTEAGPAGPEVILPYAEDALGLTVKGQKRWGQHGGFSWGAQHIPLVLAGPGVHHGLSLFPAKLVDIVPTVAHLLGLPIPGNVDGVVLADALTRAGAHAVSAQNATVSDRKPHVQALRRHSRAQAQI